MDDKIIIVDNVSKNFKLPHQRAGSVKNIFTNIFSLGNQTYEIQHALKEIDFEVKRGEFFGIVGRNGSGKSTLLKILAGIYQPTKGKVRIGGRIVPFIELGVGFNGELTGRENVFLNGALLGFSEKEVEARYQDIVDFAELERFMDQKLKNYSSGMQVRLAFSVATRLAESDILLIDEVLAVGDADFQRKCFQYFKQLKKHKKTVVFVTHDMNAVREYCDRAMLIEKSEQIKLGSAEDIATAYTKLFMKKHNETPSADTKSRWGSGEISHKKVTLTPKVLTEDFKEIQMDVEVQINADIEEPVFGFSIKNYADTTLFGTNTKIKHIKTGKLKAGGKKIVTWKIPNIFEDGEYFINFATVQSDGLTVCEWWDEAAGFKVYKKEKTPYIISPEIDVRIG